MPDGDLEINKKMGLLNYELLMMIKGSCMSAMKNYLLKRDLRVGKFSDTLDGVSALRQLYRKLQERLNTGQGVELGSNSLEDLRSIVKETIGGPDVLAARTWIEYGKTIGLAIPVSASSSATSISSARRIIRDSDVESDGDEEDESEKDVDSDNEEEKVIDGAEEDEQNKEKDVNNGEIGGVVADDKGPDISANSSPSTAEGLEKDEDEDDDYEFPTDKFSAESITKILQIHKYS